MKCEIHLSERDKALVLTAFAEVESIYHTGHISLARYIKPQRERGRWERKGGFGEVGWIISSLALALFLSWLITASWAWPAHLLIAFNAWSHGIVAEPRGVSVHPPFLSLTIYQSSLFHFTHSALIACARVDIGRQNFICFSSSW